MKISLKNQHRGLKPFFWFGFILVFTLNIFIWLYVDQIENEFRDQLENKISAAGKLISRLIEETEISIIIPGDHTSIEYLYYRQLLQDVLHEHELQNIFLLSPQMELLIALPEIPGATLIKNFTGNIHFEQALLGKTSVSGIQDFSGERFMSVFTPILNIDGFVTSVLILEAPANYFTILSTLRNRILFFSLINLILLAAFAFLLLRMIKKTIEYQTRLKDEEHLVQLGTMAANVAHELRNPLNIIEGTNDVIRKKYAAAKDELFDFIPEEVKRLSGMIDHFLQFARTPVLQPECKPIETLITRLKLGTAGKSNSRLHFHQPEKPVDFTTDFGILEQALSNLIVNALQATDHGGNVHVLINKTRSGKLLCEIKDNGAGIKPEITQKIFEPFFTTKEKGTGLGLAISKRQIGYLGGELAVQSESGKCTTFCVTIPELKR